MKKFTKLFLSCAAMAAVTAAVATSAMAAAPTISATYEEANLNGELTLSVQGVTGEVTLLVTQKDITKDTIADADILYVDQETATDAGAAEFGTAGKVGLRTNSTEAGKYLQDGKYNVYVGYTDGEDFKVATNTFRVGKGSDVIVGDVTMDSKFGTDDASAVLKHIVKPYLEGDALIAAQQSNKLGDTKVGTDDASEILKYIVKKTSDSVGHAAE